MKLEELTGRLSASERADYDALCTETSKAVSGTGAARELASRVTAFLFRALVRLGEDNSKKTTGPLYGEFHRRFAPKKVAEERRASPNEILSRETNTERRHIQIEAGAYLASVLAKQGKLDEARQWAEAVLARAGELNGEKEPQARYLCAGALQAVGEKEGANKQIRLAHKRLLEIADRISRSRDASDKRTGFQEEPEIPTKMDVRDSFLTNVLLNREIIEAGAALNLSESSDRIQR